MSDVTYKGKMAAGIIAGSAIGVVTGLLMAPKSGREMRHSLIERTKDTASTVKDKTSDVQNTAQEKMGATADKLSDKIS